MTIIGTKRPDATEIPAVMVTRKKKTRRKIKRLANENILVVRENSNLNVVSDGVKNKFANSLYSSSYLFLFVKK